MFKTPDGQAMKTWNVFTGCKFDCAYCSARDLALTRLKHLEKYRRGFEPSFHPGELHRRFRPGEFVLVAYMGDISFASREVVINILEQVRKFPETDFLFCTKNPLTYWYWELHWPDNVYFGATIETNRDYKGSTAPQPWERFRDMQAAVLKGKRKFISIEPVMDFDLDMMVSWMLKIQPEIIEVGADNYGNGLEEPSADKSRQLLRELREFCPNVIEKKGLERLLKKTSP